jgi:manganese-dependent inorganic pyrophosphatase
MNIYITGHISPDLDSVASAYTYAEYLKKSKRYEGAHIIPVRAGEPNNETTFVFNKLGVEMPKYLGDFEIESGDGFILVDHNEESQRHEKVKAEQVLEIVDHHKIHVSFTSPVRIDVKPFGCSNTLIHELFEMYGIEISKEVKGLMLSAILSDTVGLKSSTTTGFDSEVAHKLAGELEIDLDKYTFEIFKAKSDLTGLKSSDIVRKDFKVFDFSGTKVFINQVETVEPEKLIEQKEDLIKALEDVKVKEGVGQAYLIITDILKVNSQAIYATEAEKEIIEKAFTTQGINNVADIGPKMSRKKDIAPAIEKAQVN